MVMALGTDMAFMKDMATNMALQIIPHMGIPKPQNITQRIKRKFYFQLVLKKSIPDLEELP